MKKSYIFLVGILSICNPVLSMETREATVKRFNDLYAAAQKFEKQAKETEDPGQESKLMAQALEKYGQAAEIEIPKATGTYQDEYSIQRKNKQLAINKLEDAAGSLTKVNKMGEALKIYQLAPVTFETQIEFAQEVINEELTRARTDIFPKAMEFAAEDEYKKAFTLLNETIDDPNEYDVVKQAAEGILNLIQHQKAKASKVPEKALISALQNLKNGLDQLAKSLTS